MVIGGGAAGMEAARVAAERGHSVSLYEKEAFLGGQLMIASKTTNRAEMKKPIAYYQNQLKRLGVLVQLGTAVTRETDRDGKMPDEIIVATGGLPKGMSIPGAGSGQVVQGRDVLLGKPETGKRVVVVAADGGMEGLSTAEFLADQGKKVEVLIPQYKAGQDLENVTGYHLFYRLRQKGVVLTPERELKPLKARPWSLQRGEPYTIENVDTIVLSLGSASNDELLRSLSGFKNKVHAVGQCRQVGGLFESISDGLKVGLEI